MKKTLLSLALSFILTPICFGQAPTVAAPTPTLDPSNVISIFSDAYTNLSGTNFNPGWGQATVESQVLIAGNNTLKYANLNYQGTEFTPQNLVTMNNVHFDYWTADAASLKLSLVDKTQAAERAYAVATVTQDAWVSVDIPLSTFTAQGLSISSIWQFKFEGNGTVYLDNLYFSGGATTPENDASLSDLSIDGATISGFSTDLLTYTVELPRGTTVVPELTATSTQAGASVVITAASGIPGTSTVEVTATDGTTIRTYSVAFTESISFPIDFEVGTYSFVDFSGGVGTVISNPYSSGINTSAEVAQIVRGAGEIWAGSKLVLPYKLDLSTTATFFMKVYSPKAGIPVYFKLEGDGGVNTQVTTTLTTVANQWEKLSWDFTGKPSNTYNALTFMFDFGTVGDGSANSTFLFDDIELIDKTTVGVPNLNSANNNVAVYPNPAKNDLYFTSKTTQSKVEIFNVVGKQVKEYGNILQSVDISDLNTGVYFIKLTDVNGKTVISKFIKK